MSVSNKDVVWRLYHEFWNDRKLEIADQLVSKSHALNDPTNTGSAVGPEAYRRQARRFLAAFPDLEFSVEEYIAENEKVVAQWTMTGTHKGEFHGIPPTNKKISLIGITIHHLADGKILDSYAIWDALDLFHQLEIALPGKFEKRVASAR